MRMFMPLLLVSSLCLVAQEPQQNEVIEVDSLDYSSMLQLSSTILNSAFGEQLGELAKDGSATRLVPANDEEKMALIGSYIYFLIAVARMHQEAACFLDASELSGLIRSVWEQGLEIFELMPEEIQATGAQMVRQWLEEHAEDAWAPVENAELYKPALECAESRSVAAKEYCQSLEQLSQSA